MREFNKRTLDEYVAEGKTVFRIFLGRLDKLSASSRDR